MQLDEKDIEKNSSNLMIVFDKISVNLILNSPSLLLSDWSPVLHPLFLREVCRDNSVLQQRD